MVAYIACGMMTRNQVMVYRHLLQFIQEEVKRDGKIPMAMWLYDMNAKLFLVNRIEYDNISLEDHKRNVFNYKDRGIMETTLANLPEYQAAFHSKQPVPYKNFHKPEGGRNQVNLPKADDLALQAARANQSFLDKSRAAGKTRQRNAGKDQWTSGKEDPKKPSG